MLKIVIYNNKILAVRSRTTSDVSSIVSNHSSAIMDDDVIINDVNHHGNHLRETGVRSDVELSDWSSRPLQPKFVKFCVQLKVVKIFCHLFIYSKSFQKLQKLIFNKKPFHKENYFITFFLCISFGFDKILTIRIV